MAADIEQSTDGRATFVAVKEHGWHRLGTLVDHEITVAEGLKLAHLADLDYHTEPIAVPVGDPPRFIFGENLRAVVRRDPFDTDQWQVLGAGMTDAYTIHTPEDVFGFGETLIDSGKPLAALGSIAGGRKGFAAFKADDLTIGGVDQVRMFLNVMTGFVANQATVCRASGIRVECSNTFHMVMGQRDAPTYTVRHVGDGLEGRIEDARAALQIGYAGMEVFQEEAEALFAKEIIDTEFAQMVKDFTWVPEAASDAAKNKAGEAADKIMALYNGPTLVKVNGTAWGALNAMTEYLDWTSGSFRTEENRMVAQITPGSVIDGRRIKASKVVAKAVGLVTAGR